MRATEGFARSLFGLMHLDLPVPDSSTLCRRAATVRITQPKRATGPLHRLQRIGRAAWKEESGDHRRSRGKTAMFRLKG